MQVEIHLSSAIAPVATEPAATLLRAASNAEPERRHPARDEEAVRGDPVAIAALILAVPAAILATMDMVERAGVVEKVQGLLNRVREADGDATLHVGDEPPLDLNTATEDEVMDLLAKSGLP